jgi:hypothetical protein
MAGTKSRDIPAGRDADRVTCGPQAMWGWSPPDIPADTALKRGVDRVLPRTGFGFFIYWAVVFALEFSLAPHLPARGRLSVEGAAALLGAAWCGLNFWRCRHAHCAVSALGWSALGGLGLLGAAIGHSLIGGYDQLVFLGVLVLALVFEALWYRVHRTNAITQLAKPSPVRNLGRDG